MAAQGAVGDVLSYLLDKVDYKYNGLPDRWAFSDAPRPAPPGRVQLRKEWQAVIDHESWMAKRDPTAPFPKKASTRRLAKNPEEAKPLGKLSARRHLAVMLTDRHPPMSTGCVPFHAIPVQVPALPYVSPRFLAPDLDVDPPPRPATGYKEKRKLHGDRPLTALQTIFSPSAPATHRDDTMASALIRYAIPNRLKAVREHRRVALLAEGERNWRLLFVTLKIQRAFRSRKANEARSRGAARAARRDLYSDDMQKMLSSGTSTTAVSLRCITTSMKCLSPK